MKTEVVRRLSPEDEELAIKREELARLEGELAEQELLLASLRAELAAFEGLYLRRVGVLYAELDEWNARVAEMEAERRGTAEAKAEAAQARIQAEDSRSAAHGKAAEAPPFAPSPELKSLYREVAKRVHPDTSVDEADRGRRERLMQKVNAAYAAGNADILKRILADEEISPEAVRGAGVGADLVRVLRQLKQVRDRIAAIETEIAGLSTTEIAKLKARSDLASTEERDLLGEMAAALRVKVNAVRQHFEAASSGGVKV